MTQKKDRYGGIRTRVRLFNFHLLMDGMDALDLEKARSQLDIELRIKEGAENLLSAFEAGSVQRAPSFDDPEFRGQVELELESANARVAALEQRIQELTQARKLQTLLDPTLLRRPESPLHSPLVTPSDAGDFVFSPHPENGMFLVSSFYCCTI